MLASPQDYRAAIDKLNSYARAYYVLDDPIASDEEYDTLYHELKAYERAHPESIAPDSPTQRVGGAVLESFEKHEHLQRMWSLDDVFDIAELEEWVARIRKSYPEARFTCSPKFDGASLNLCYENGLLVSAATRGDGIIGEEVLHNAKTLTSIPLAIPHKSTIEIRGEVVIPKNDFARLNASRAEQGLPLFANPRNAAAGSLRQLDSSITAERRLLFIPWGLGFARKKLHWNLYGSMLMIEKFGFRTPKIYQAQSIHEIHDCYEQIQQERESFPIMLDGVVVMVDKFFFQKNLGWTIKSPRFACAYKFPAVEKITKILSITNQVGRTGVITPVAELEPVEIEGAMISRASLYNYADIEKKDIRIGDSVIIIRSGDVIPKIIKPLESRRDGSQMKLAPPTHCPECGSTLTQEEVILRCCNLSCKARILESIIYFASKRALNIDGLGEKIITQLYNAGKIASIIDLYALSTESLLELEGFKDKKASNLIAAIAKSKHVALWRFINALGITHIGEWASKELDRHFGLACFGKSYEEIIEIAGFGQEMAESFVEFSAVNADLIARLLTLIEPRPAGARASGSGSSGALDSGADSGGFGLESSAESKRALENLTFVITGTLSIPRDDMRERLENLGARVSGSVSKKTDYVLCGHDAGSKEQKARALGVKIITEAELEKLLKP